MRDDPAPVPMVERLAYVLREWEASHATYQDLVVNGSNFDSNGERYVPVKTECQCQHCQDARTVLEAYEGKGGDDRAERIRY